MDAASHAINKVFESLGNPNTSTQEDLDRAAKSDSTAQDMTSTKQTKSNADQTDLTAEKDVAPAVESNTATKDIDAAKDIDTTVEKETAPAVEHETVTNKHEQKDETVIDRERHQHHYHTTVQPLKDQEVLPTEHEHTESATENRQIDRDGDADAVKAQVANDQSQFQNSSTQGETVEKQSADTTVASDQIHHHLHETVQPVIEKETVQPSVTHNKIPVKETIQEASQNEGVTTNSAISVDEFKGRLDGESKSKQEVQEGAPQVE